MTLRCRRDAAEMTREMRRAAPRSRGGLSSCGSFLIWQAGGVAAAARENEAMGAALARREENSNEEVHPRSPILHNVLAPLMTTFSANYYR